MDEVTLSGLLSAKLCHDLVNPVGAARNGLDLMADETDPALQKEALQLTNDSLADALARLKYLRLAFGSESPGHMIQEARKAATDLFARSKVELDWPEGGVEAAPAAVRLGLNLILVAADALPRGGSLQVDWQAERITITCTGERAVLRPEAQAALTMDGDGAGAEAKLAPAFLAAALARRVGAAITCEVDAERVRIVCPIAPG